MIVIEPQEVEVGQVIPFEGKQLVVKDIYTDGSQLRMQNPKYIMSTRRGYYLLEEFNG